MPYHLGSMESSTLEVQPWYLTVSGVKSLGSQHRSVGTLAGLHEDRRAHLGQFFTPLDVVGFIWRALGDVRSSLIQSGAIVSLMDNSCGSGRMFAYADPENYELVGCDVHGPAVGSLAEAATAAGFTCDLLTASMESVRFGSAHIALINPPFSIQLEGPTLEQFPCNSFGRFGPGSSAISQSYALHQALDSAHYVAAVLPRAFVPDILADEAITPRLKMVAHLPSKSFRNEGTDVATSILFFDAVSSDSAPEVIKIADLNTVPRIDFTHFKNYRCNPRVRSVGVSFETPVITTPVTGSPVVKIHRAGRKFLLRFECGFTEARVRNSILVDRARVTDMSIRRGNGSDAPMRQPRELAFIGSARLLIDAYLCQEDPMQAIDEFLVGPIRSAGGKPVFSPGVLEFMAKQAKKMQVHRTPFRHVIYQKESLSATTGTAIAGRLIITDRSKWGSPIIKAKQKVRFTRQPDGSVKLHLDKDQTWTLPEADFGRSFKVDVQEDAGGWITKFEGRVHLHPNYSKPVLGLMKKLGISEWLYDFQNHDVAEMFISPFGAIGALRMGLGKARIAIALCLLSTAKHNLITVEPHLVDEMVTELEKVGVPADQWQVIDHASRIQSLKKINVISYSRLRIALCPGHRDTYAKAMRRRFGLVVADEGHLLRNQETDQSRALQCLAARKRILLTGTPIANYPRNSLPLASWVYGSSNAVQPYGTRGPFIQPRLLTSCSFATRGVDQFRSDFTVEEWVTNEYAENMGEGAKREIPRIKDLNLYRQWIAPLMKRRIVEEPEVAKDITIPKPKSHTITVDFESDHLDYYLEVAEDFCSHYAQARRNAGAHGNLNLIALLARIGAVGCALNTPDSPRRNVLPFYRAHTAKHAALLELCREFTKQGKKTIIFTERPHAAETIRDLLGAAGITAVVLHGEVQQKVRTRLLREEFRFGDAPVLIATKGVCKTGLNIPEASRVIFYDRDWSASVEDQALCRVLRPQQKDKVLCYYLHVRGSLDEYQGQMVEHKRDCSNAGLDWATPEFDQTEFLHMDTILSRFVDDIGMKMSDRSKGLAFA